MLKLGGIMLVSLGALLLGASSTLAGGVAARPGDIAATRAYLTASHQLERPSKSGGKAVEAVLHGLVAHINASCPNVLAGAPEDRVTQELRGEVLADVSTALSRLGRKRTLVFFKRVKGLRWSNRKLTYYVHGFAAEAKANAELVAPDICVDAKAAVAGGFQTVPDLTQRFDKEFNAANDKTKIPSNGKKSEGLEEIILRMLKPYEVADEKTLLPPHLSAHAREAQELLGIKLVFGTAVAMVHALGLPGAKAPAVTTPAA